MNNLIDNSLTEQVDKIDLSQVDSTSYITALENELNRRIIAQIQSEFDSFNSIDGYSHHYLAKKSINAPDGLRLDKKDLIVPAYLTFDDWRAGNICSFQRILHSQFNGTDKLFRKNGKTGGAFFPIGLTFESTPSIIYLAEGLATGASVNQFTKQPVMVAFNAGNLLPVAIKVREQYPDALIIVAGDDDQWKAEGKSNVGREKALAVIQLVDNVTVAFPDFTGLDMTSKPTDFNDLAKILANGHGDVAGEMMRQLKPKDSRLLINTRFLSDSIPTLDIENYPTIELKVPMGSGKTEAIIRTCAEKGIEKIIVVTSRRTLVDGVIQRFWEFKTYHIQLDDYRNGIDGSTKKVAACCNSASKLPFGDDQLSNFMLIIDESEQVLTQLATMDKLGHTLEPDYDYLRRAIKFAKNVIAADANLGELTSSILKELRGDRPILRVESTYKPGDGREVKVWKKKALLWNEVDKSLKYLKKNERILFVSDSANLIEQILCHAKKMGKRVIAITGDSKNDSLESDFIANINTEILNYDLIAYSPAISSGVSITDVSELKLKVFGFFSSMSGPTPEDAWQQLGRYRGRVNYNVHIENRVENKPTTTEECLKEFSVKAFAKAASVNEENSRELYKAMNLATADNQDLSTTVLNFINKIMATPYTLLQARVAAKTNSLCNNFSQSFIRLAEEQGYTVKFIEADNPKELKAARKNAKAAKQAAKEEYIKTIVESSEISAKEAAKIEADDKAKSHNLHALERFKIKEFYGEVTPEIVAQDDRGQLRYKIKRLLRLANPEMERRRDVDDIIDLFEGKLSIGHLKARKLYCDDYTGMSSWAGYFIDEVLWHDGRIVTSEALIKAGFLEWVKKNEKHLKLFHAVPKDIASKPVAYLQRFLEDLGLELKCVGGHKVKQYVIDEDKFNLISRFVNNNRNFT